LFSQYALVHAWLIPLLPAVACVVIGLFMRRTPALAAVVSIGLSLTSFLLAVGVGAGVLAQGITVDQPFIQRTPWLFPAGIVGRHGSLS